MGRNPWDAIVAIMAEVGLAEGKHIVFEHAGCSPSGKTRIVTVRPWGDRAILLGTISWYATLGRYVFAPYDGTMVFDAESLREIANFLAAMTIEQWLAPAAI